MSILIFGGTTEGRVAVEVCSGSDTPFYYSTRHTYQDIQLPPKAVRLTGAMTAEDIRRFCHEHQVGCIVDASHPFAVGLHQSVAAAAIPVIRFERPSSPHYDDVVYCRDLTQAIDLLNQHAPRRLLALTGVNTIGPLRSYWQAQPDTFFRILPHSESLQLAHKYEFPDDHLLYYHAEAESQSDALARLVAATHADAIITKDSGDSGHYAEKVKAAVAMGLQVFVVQRPPYPVVPAHTVDGPHGLRLAIQHVLPDYFALNIGLTTGSHATAAVQAALQSLLQQRTDIDDVAIRLPQTGETIHVPVSIDRPGTATTIKAHNDDPDVTRGCHITATLRLLPDQTDVTFLRGQGIGLVTLPGLGIPVGSPAINPVPRRMMTEAIRALTPLGCEVTLSVAEGQRLAPHTFNPRLGVTDGISIIGTTGIVTPLSNEAFVQSIHREMQVHVALGHTHIGLASGRQGEEHLHEPHPQLPVIHYGNLVGAALHAAHQLHIPHVTLCIAIGKAVKLAEGHLDTHSRKVQMNKEFLKTLDPDHADLIDSVHLARELWPLMPDIFFQRLRDHCYHHARQVYPQGQLDILLY